MELNETKGYQLAISFKPFIDPKCKEHDEIVKDMAKAINRQIQNSELKSRVKQFLSSLNYNTLTDFQAKCVLLLEKELNQ